MTKLKSSVKIVVVIIISLFLYKCKDTVDLNADITRCDSAKVNKIVVSQKNNITELIRKNNKFEITSNQKLNKKAVEKLLSLLYDLKIKMPVSNIDSDSIKEQLKANGLSIEFIDKDNTLCHWMIGKYSDKYGATAMMNATGDRVFMTEIPGIETDLETYCAAELDFWIDHTLFSYKYFNISKVYLEYSGNDSINSFELKIAGDSIFLNDYEGIKKKNINKKAVGQYLTYFEDVQFFKNKVALSQNRQDSVLNSKEIVKLKIEDTLGKTMSVKLYSVFNSKTKTKHKHYAYLKKNDDKNLKTVKYYDFDLLFKSPQYFLE